MCWCMKGNFLSALLWLVQYFTERGVFRPFPPTDWALNNFGHVRYVTFPAPTGYRILLTRTLHHVSSFSFILCFVEGVLLDVVGLNAPFPPPMGGEASCRV